MTVVTSRANFQIAERVGFCHRFGTGSGGQGGRSTICWR
jgi:hypothetical protein